MKNLLSSFPEFANEIKSFGITEIFVYDNEVHTTSFYTLPFELIERIEKAVQKLTSCTKVLKSTSTNGIWINRFIVKDGNKIVGKIYEHANGTFNAKANGMQATSKTYDQAFKDICFLNDRLYSVTPVRCEGVKYPR